MNRIYETRFQASCEQKKNSRMLNGMQPGDSIFFPVLCLTNKFCLLFANCPKCFKIYYNVFFGNVHNRTLQFSTPSISLKINLHLAECFCWRTPTTYSSGTSENFCTLFGMHPMGNKSFALNFIIVPPYATLNYTTPVEHLSNQSIHYNVKLRREVLSWCTFVKNRIGVQGRA